ncbi:hypothetical protein BLX42_10750 [Pseudomonas sp. SG-MS2]|nr:hypothetical protein BLX42_10750 [Pseudomonas sp. SG-MS2]
MAQQERDQDQSPSPAFKTVLELPQLLFGNRLDSKMIEKAQRLLMPQAELAYVDVGYQSLHPLSSYGETGLSSETEDEVQVWRGALDQHGQTTNSIAPSKMMDIVDKQVNRRLVSLKQLQKGCERFAETGLPNTSQKAIDGYRLANELQRCLEVGTEVGQISVSVFE